MIPDFPEMKPICIADRPEIEAHARRHLPVSDFNFASLFCYGAGTFAAGWLKGNLIARIRAYVIAGLSYAFLNDRKLFAAAATVLERCTDEGLAPRLRPVPERVIAALAIAGLTASKDEAGCRLHPSCCDRCPPVGSERIQAVEKGSAISKKVCCTNGVS